VDQIISFFVPGNQSSRTGSLAAGDIEGRDLKNIGDLLKMVNREKLKRTQMKG